MQEKVRRLFKMNEAVKCCTQYVSKFGKLSSGQRIRKGQFSFQSHKARPNNVQIILWLMEKTLNLGMVEGKRRGWQRMRWLNSIIDIIDMNLSKLWEILEDRGVCHAAVLGVVKSQTQLSDWITTNDKSWTYLKSRSPSQVFFFLIVCFFDTELL